MARAGTVAVAPAILVVEDDRAIRALLVDAFADVAGWPVTVAASGSEALDLLDTVQPALIVLDVGLPDLDGIALYRVLRARDALVAVPVLFVTAADRGRAQGLEGPFRWLGKPFDLEILFAAVAALLHVDPWT